MDRAIEHGLGACPRCHKVIQMTDAFQKCPRCHKTFTQRKPKSLQYTMAWTIAALIMLIPANLFPMMVYYKLGVGQASTIFEGIIQFIQSGMLPIALIIFVASFVIPLGKILALFYLMYNAKKSQKSALKQQSKLYHLVEYLGPWSMLDVFVVAVMAAVVKLGFITNIEAADGITYFTLMVVFTMFAAESFDPRLLWDNHSEQEK